ncbi:MAG: hypothetical protein HY549_04400 [Elusimicrobia bacterium]|nr:hypothetical protein [Elusimicrobiota bacterium]
MGKSEVAMIKRHFSLYAAGLFGIFLAAMISEAGMKVTIKKIGPHIPAERDMEVAVPQSLKDFGKMFQNTKSK